MDVMALHRARRGKDHRVLDFLLGYDVFDSGEQVGSELKPERHNAVELTGNGVDFRNLVAAGLQIVRGIGGRISLVAAGLLRPQARREQESSARFSSRVRFYRTEIRKGGR